MAWRRRSSGGRSCSSSPVSSRGFTSLDSFLLSIAFPLSRVVDAMVPLGCWIFLGEAISTRRWVGIALVIVGLAVIARPVARLEEEL